MPDNARSFRSLYFGEAAAEDEAEKNPDLFLKSFYDLRGALERIVKRDAYLLLGPKGSGKSSYMEYLRLKAQGTHQSFAHREDLGEFRGALKADATFATSGSELSEMAWSAWIWTRLLDSLMQDQAASIQSNPDIIKLYRELQVAGVVNGDFTTVFREVRKRQHKFTAPKFYEYTVETEGGRLLNLEQLRELLATIVCDAETPNDHTLAIDGLDNAEIGTDAYWRQLAALLRACTAVHRRLRSARSPVSVCLLCRSDVFLRIPIPDSNKIRQGWGIEFNWSYGSDAPEDSYLWDLLEKKVAARGKPLSDIVGTYFPQYMQVGTRTTPRTISMPRYLVDLTRGTPRDIIMLMKYIQDELPTNSLLDVRRVRAGVNSYCKSYFAGEITNELTGMVPNEVARVAIGSMSRLPGRGFTRKQFLSTFESVLASNSVEGDALLQQLYLAGAIASITPASGGEDYVRFYHRRSYAELDLRGPFILHNALTLALNLPWTKA